MVMATQGNQHVASVEIIKSKISGVYASIPLATLHPVGRETITRRSVASAAFGQECGNDPQEVSTQDIISLGRIMHAS
jgi:hypothetical protein